MPPAAEVWTHLAFHRGRRPVPGGAAPPQARRDDPPPPLPRQPFRPDLEVFLHTLARLPQVRQPWLRAVYDRVRADRHAPPF
ncbi:hypothetical protein Psi01_47710 [Planobispora siamensis]|uniref:Uncharacterized protein n=1 Tax=Planobispora siamensis TaxID=936338 RepID=A0A8J3WNQ9_9ACTN|nr:hypothetical protein Psi01_47710 [Planobispora siamensis]